MKHLTGFKEELEDNTFLYGKPVKTGNYRCDIFSQSGNTISMCISKIKLRKKKSRFKPELTKVAENFLPCV